MAGNNDTQRAHAIEGWPAFLGGFSSETASGNITLDATYGPFVRIDPGGANRDVTLPAEDRTNYGRWFLIANAADNAENLVVKDADGNTIATVNQNEGCIVACGESNAWSLVILFTAPVS